MRFSINSLFIEIMLRIIMAIIFLQMENMSPFNRQIHPDEMWLYRNPRRESYVSTTVLWTLALVIPVVMAILHLIFTKDYHDFIQLLLGISLALGINCILTDLIKLIVGRPRPDFFWRCFPDGEMNSDLLCSGRPDSVIDGRKSFPSGHSSISFCSMGFMSWWSMGKLRVWNENGRGRGWAVVVSIVPLCIALCVALSRTCDYHHHWQDVLVGSLMGLSISYMCYRQFYPAFTSARCFRAYGATVPQHISPNPSPPPYPDDLPPPETKDNQVKWI